MKRPVIHVPERRDAGIPLCVRCHSHFCPHVRPDLYQPPFTEKNELAPATEKWDRWLAGKRPAALPRRRRQRPAGESQRRLFGSDE